MHYAPVLSTYLVSGNVQESSRTRVRRYYVRRTASWRNWWTMSVTEPPARRSPTAPPIGDRGRLPGV